MTQYTLKVFSLIIAGVLFMACAKLPVYNSVNTASKVSPPRTHLNSENKLTYVVEHDDQNLYITLSTSDTQTQSQILTEGLTIWTDHNAKKNQTLGFTYPILAHNRTNDEELQRPNRSQSGEPNNNSLRSQKLFERYKKSAKEIKLIGFKSLGTSQLVNPALENSPVAVIIEMNENSVLTYSATIPLQPIFAETTAPFEKLSVGIFAKAPAMPQRAGGNRQGQGGQRGGPGGGPGGGPSGGGRPSGGSQGPGSISAPSDIDFWFQVNLNNTAQ